MNDDKICSVQLITDGDVITRYSNLSFGEALDKAAEQASTGLFRPEVNICVNDGCGHLLNIRTHQTSRVWNQNQEKKND